MGKARIENLRNFIFFVIIVSIAATTPVFAQQNEGGWTPPEIIYQTGGTLTDSNMALVADQAGQLHLFFPHKPEGATSYSIDYMLWDGTKWAEPIDIMIDPGGDTISFVNAAIDDSGQVVHLIWHGTGDKLWYASAPLVLARQARGWSKPQEIGDVLGEPDIIAGPDGALYVAYSNALALGTLSLVYSTNAGKNWSSPVSITLSLTGSTPDEPRLAIDLAGRLQATWTEYQLPGGWPPTGVFYSRSVDKGLTWGAPLQIAEAWHAQSGIVAVGQDNVHLVWRSTVGRDGTYHQWSDNGGETWFPPDQYADGGGLSGLPTFAIDSTNAVHYVIGPGKVATWQEGSLGSYLDVVGGKLRADVEQGIEQTSAEHANLAITTGNRLHVVFETSFNKLWHTSRLVDAPIIEPVALPTITLLTPRVAPTVIPKPTPTPILRPERMVILAEDNTAEGNFSNPGLSIMLGILPVVVLIGGTISLWILFRHRN